MPQVLQGRQSGRQGLCVGRVAQPRNCLSPPSTAQQALREATPLGSSSAPAYLHRLQRAPVHGLLLRLQLRHVVNVLLQQAGRRAAGDGGRRVCVCGRGEDASHGAGSCRQLPLPHPHPTHPQQHENSQAAKDRQGVVEQQGWSTPAAPARLGVHAEQVAPHGEGLAQGVGHHAVPRHVDDLWREEGGVVTGRQKVRCGQARQQSATHRPRNSPSATVARNPLLQRTLGQLGVGLLQQQRKHGGVGLALVVGDQHHVLACGVGVGWAGGGEGDTGSG